MNRSISVLTTAAVLVITSLIGGGYVLQAYSQVASNQTNMTAGNTNASSMEGNITGANANNTNASAPHAANMTPEKVLGPNGTAPS